MANSLVTYSTIVGGFFKQNEELTKAITTAHQKVGDDVWKKGNGSETYAKTLLDAEAYVDNQGKTTYYVFDILLNRLVVPQPLFLNWHTVNCAMMVTCHLQPPDFVL